MTTEEDIAARIAEIDENAQLQVESGNPTFFETRWITSMSAAEKREYVISELDDN